MKAEGYLTQRAEHGDHKIRFCECSSNSGLRAYPYQKVVAKDYFPGKDLVLASDSENYETRGTTLFVVGQEKDRKPSKAAQKLLNMDYYVVVWKADENSDDDDDWEICAAVTTELDATDYIRAFSDCGGEYHIFSPPF